MYTYEPHRQTDRQTCSCKLGILSLSRSAPLQHFPFPPCFTQDPRGSVIAHPLLPK